LGALFGVAILLSPFHFRYSRVVLLYWLTPGVHFDPKRAEMKSKEANQA
jgi:hypothetical protein